MLDKYQDIRDEFNNGEKKFSAELNNFSEIVDEIREHAFDKLDNIKNVNIIIKDIDKHFSEKTGIVKTKDMIFLWSAVAIQCARWILVPTFDIETLTPTTDDRKNSQVEGKKDKTETGKQLDKTKKEREKHKFPDTKDILLLPVPYDAMKGTKDIVIPGVTEYGKEIYGINHRSATLGHDPIIGQLVGTANIMTRSITFHDTLTTTRKVGITSGRTQIVVKDPYYNKELMVGDMIKSIKEDDARITAALVKENLHLQSDKYTKTGLPIPFLSAKMQQKLLDQKWNSKELEDVIKGSVKGIATNFAVGLIVNTIVGALHGFCYNESTDDNKRLYSARTRKIVATSSVIAEGLNLGVVATGGIVGILSENIELVKKSISHLDIGGIIEAIHQILKSKRLQEEVRREFLEHELFNCFTSNKYTFLEESYYE